MSIEQLCGMDVAPIMHQDSILCLWVTNFVLARALHIPVLSAWGGFEPKTVITWPKDRPGRGRWAFGQTEHLVLAVRGQAIVTLSDRTTTLLRGPFHLVRKNAHSEKPIESYAFVESLCPAPRYADLFSRYRHNEKWDCHGDQARAAVDERPEQWDEMWARPFDHGIGRVPFVLAVAFGGVAFCRVKQVCEACQQGNVFGFSPAESFDQCPEHLDGCIAVDWREFFQPQFCAINAEQLHPF